jgi:hypothetical protein
MGKLVAGVFVGNYDVAKNGRVLGLFADKDDYQLIVVPDWLPELRQRLAASTKR